MGERLTESTGRYPGPSAPHKEKSTACWNLNDYGHIDGPDNPKARVAQEIFEKTGVPIRDQLFGSELYPQMTNNTAAMNILRYGHPEGEDGLDNEVRAVAEEIQARKVAVPEQKMRASRDEEGGLRNIVAGITGLTIGALVLYGAFKAVEGATDAFGITGDKNPPTVAPSTAAPAPYGQHSAPPQARAHSQEQEPAEPAEPAQSFGTTPLPNSSAQAPAENHQALVDAINAQMQTYENPQPQGQLPLVTPVEIISDIAVYAPDGSTQCVVPSDEALARDTYGTPYRLTEADIVSNYQVNANGQVTVLGTLENGSFITLMPYLGTFEPIECP